MESGWWVALAANLAVSLGLVAWLCSAELQYPLNSAQATVGIAYFTALLCWAEAELMVHVALKLGYRLVDGTSPSTPRAGENKHLVDEGGDDISEGEDLDPSQDPVLPITEKTMNGLRACAELSAIMVLMYVCDRTTLVGKGNKLQSKAGFWGVFLLCLVLSCLGLRRTKEAPPPDDQHCHVKPLQREQTEEWKGWMQVMFLLYHYWVATEMYNAIRIYIAAYIWMTGFGNFSYYYIKRDFGLPRFVQMMWRLNFLVVFVCLTLNNEYMLYYICPLHTLFTIMVYATLYFGNKLNQSSPGFLVGKIVAVFVLSVVIWDVPGVFDLVFSPLQPLLGYKGDLFTMKMPIMHEWHFRSHLDHLVWIFGMVVAYSFPRLDGWVNSLDGSSSEPEKPVVRSIAITATVTAFAAWVAFVFMRAKFEYNALHPYTSFIPIGCYIFLRNSTRWLREHVLPAWGEVGKYTLETYICQFHIWMRTTGENGNPKSILVLVPGSFWVNFVVTTAFYLFISMRLFKVTVALKDIVVPNDVPTIMSNFAKVAAGAAAFTLVGFLTHSHFSIAVVSQVVVSA